MVDVTVYASAGDFDLQKYLAIDTVVARRSASGTNIFFTGNDVYGAPAYAHRDAEGAWNGKLFFGGTVIDANGGVGFAPHALMSGFIGATPVDRYLDVIADRGFTTDQIERRLLAGDDHLTGSVYDDVLSGKAGRDVLDGGSGGDTLDGGDGDDLIFTGDDLRYVYYGSDTSGGKGNDEIAIGANYSGRVYGGRGDDVIYLGSDSPPDGLTAGQNITEVYGSDEYRSYRVNDSDTYYLAGIASVTTIEDFDDRSDKVVLDSGFFQAFQGMIDDGNVVIGDQYASSQEADDFIIVARNDYSHHENVYYDSDGSGPQAKVIILQMYSAQALSSANFEIGHWAGPSTGPVALDHGEGSSSSHALHWPAELSHLA